MAEASQTETVSPCCTADYEQVAATPAAVTSKCDNCGKLFSDTDAEEVAQ